MALVIARYLRILEIILIEVSDFVLPWKNYDWKTRDKKHTMIFRFLFTTSSVFVGFKMFRLCYNNIPGLKPCVKGGLPSAVNLLCNHDYTMAAMNLKWKFNLKTIENNFIFHPCFNIRVRRGFAQIWCSDPFEPMAISGLRSNFGPILPFPRSPFPVPRSSFAVPGSSTSVPGSSFSVPGSSFSVPGSSFSVPGSPFPDLRSLFSVPRYPFPVLSSSFSVPRSPFLVLRSSFSVPRSPFLVLRSRSPFLVLRSSFFVPRTPFPVLRSSFFVSHSNFTIPCSSFLDLHCPFSVPCWNNILPLLWYNNGHLKHRFPKHLIAMSALIGKKNLLILRFTLDRKKFQIGLYTTEFTGELLRILSAIRVHQKKKQVQSSQLRQPQRRF